MPTSQPWIACFRISVSFLDRMVYAISTTDALTLIVLPVLLGAVAFLCCLLENQPRT